MSIDLIKSVYYELSSYFIPKKIKYKIEGECNKCGNCCREIRAEGLRNEKELKFMQLIFPHYKRFFITGKDENNNIILSCKYLNNNGECSVYDNRPKLCRDYPKKSISLNLAMPDGCGYKVIKKEFKDYL